MRHHRVTEIFIAVCELKGALRQRKLELLCKGFPELRPEVEVLLGYHDRYSKAAGLEPEDESGLDF